MKTGIILLAAGSSFRLGRAKQLIEIQGETLVNNAIKEAEKSKADGLVVVLGANAALIQTGFDSSSTPFIVNPDWQHGMSSSMQAGLRFLMEKEAIDPNHWCQTNPSRKSSRAQEALKPRSYTLWTMSTSSRTTCLKPHPCSASSKKKAEPTGKKCIKSSTLPYSSRKV